MQDDEVGAEVFYDGPRPLRWLLGQLHNCSDILPGWIADELEGSGVIVRTKWTYGAAARQLLRKRAWNDPRGGGNILGRLTPRRQAKVRPWMSTTGR